MFAPPEPRPGSGAIDFDRYVALVLSDGDSFNCRGIGLEEAWEEGDGVVLRAAHEYYQTFSTKPGEPGGDAVRPYGIFLLPKKPGTSIRVQVNVQDLLGKPAIWKERYRVIIAADPSKELDSISQ